jgi:FAD/FMN-containing dehydrogenase
MIKIDQAITELKQLLGTKGFCDDAEDMAAWLTDWRGRFTGKSRALLSPANTQEVAAILVIANRYRFAIVPQGGNSGMVGGATPDASGDEFILSLRRINDIGPLNQDTGQIRCGAGVILQNLHEAVAIQGRRFPLTLGGKGSATIGGLVSTNAGGTQVLRHGTMRALVAGLEAVLPNGTILDTMTPLKKDNRGFDLKQLMIGSEGCLGVITAALLDTVPALIDRIVIWAGVASPEQAYQLLRHIVAGAQNALEGFEILPQAALDAVLNHIEGTRAPMSAHYPWHVLMEIVQDHPDQPRPTDIAEQLISDALEKGLVGDAIFAANETQAEAFWKIRDSIAEAERASGPAVQHDISVPVADMARFITAESPEVERLFPMCRVVAFGHLGDGNIHFHVKAPSGVDPHNWFESQAKEISNHVYSRVEAYHGSISAEHGIGQLKLAEFAISGDMTRVQMLRAVKSAIDPTNILNPGKLVPLAS